VNALFACRSLLSYISLVVLCLVCLSPLLLLHSFFFFFTAPAPTEIYTLSLHDALPIWAVLRLRRAGQEGAPRRAGRPLALHDLRSEEHTSELQSRGHLVCRLLLEKKKKKKKRAQMRRKQIVITDSS